MLIEIRMKEQDKDYIEIKLLLAMMKLTEWIQNPKDNKGEIKVLIHNVQKALDDFAKEFLKEEDGNGK